MAKAPTLCLRVRRTGEIVASDARVRRDFLGLFFGWMGKTPLPGHALGLSPCEQVHTAFVGVPLDVVFCDSNAQVLRVTEGLKPWRVSRRVKKTHIVWEAAAGTFAGHVTVGDVLVLEPVPAATR